VLRSALLTQGRDSQLPGFQVFHLFRRPVYNHSRAAIDRKMIRAVRPIEKSGLAEHYRSFQIQFPS